MSMQVSRRSANPIQREGKSFLEELPDELFRIVLSYMNKKEGCALIALNHSLRTRTIEIITKNHKEYLVSLTEKLLLYFPFLPEEYREHVRITSEKALGEEFTKPRAKSASALIKLDTKSRELGLALTGKYFKTTRNYIKNSPLKLFQVCDYSSWPRGVDFYIEEYASFYPGAFFTPYSERVDKNLISLGIWFTEYLPTEAKLAYKNQLLEFCERKISEEKTQQIIEQKKQQICLNIIFYDLSSFFSDVPIFYTKVYNLVEKIAQPQIKDRAYTDFLSMPIKDDPFLQTEEFFSRLSPQMALYYFKKCRNWGNAIPCLDKIIRCSNQTEKRKLFFQFCLYFFSCLVLSTENRPTKALFSSKLAEVTDTLNITGEHEVIFRVLTEIMKERIDNLNPLNPLDDRITIIINHHDRVFSCISRLLNDHLMKQVEEKVIRPSEMLKIAYKIVNQLENCDGWSVGIALDIWLLFTNAARSCNDSIEASRIFSVYVDQLLSSGRNFFIVEFFRGEVPTFPEGFPLDRNFFLTKLIEAVNKCSYQNDLLIRLANIPLSQGVDISLRIYLMAGILKECFPNTPNKNNAICHLFNHYRIARLRDGEALAKIFLLIPQINDEEKRREFLFSLSDDELATLMQCEEGIFSEKNLFDFIQSTPWQDARDFLRVQSLHAIVKYVPQKGPLLQKLCQAIEDPAKKEEAFRFLADRNRQLLSLLHSPEGFSSLKDFSPEELLLLMFSHLEDPLQSDVLMHFFVSSLYHHAHNPPARENFLNSCKKIFGHKRLENFIARTLLKKANIPFQYLIECFQYVKHEGLRGEGTEPLLTSFLASLPDPNFPLSSAVWFINTVSLKGDEAKGVIAALRAKGSTPFNTLAHALELKMFWADQRELKPPSQFAK